MAKLTSMDWAIFLIIAAVGIVLIFATPLFPDEILIGLADLFFIFIRSRMK